MVVAYREMKKPFYYIDDKVELHINNRAGVNTNSLEHLEVQEKLWQNYLTQCSPMGKIFLSNSVLSALGSGDIVVIHATLSLDSIMKSKKIYCSGGSLGGCVYGTPLRGDYKLHNLMEFILQTELPGFMRQKNLHSKIDLLAIRVKGMNRKHKCVKSVNYMDFGSDYSKIFLNLIKKGVVNQRETQPLRRDLYSQLYVVDKFIKVCLDLDRLKCLSASEFMEIFGNAVKSAVVLKIPYFETILEYCFLFQNDEMSQGKLKIGELYNSNVKIMLFRLNPKLFAEFNLKNFEVTLQEIVKYLKRCSRRKSFILNFSERHFLNFFKWRFAHNFRYHFLKGKFTWDRDTSFCEFVDKNKSLAGHMILRSSNNPYDFELLFARKLWRRMEKEGVGILTYKNLPKGEIGIIPNDKFRYEVCSAKINNAKVELKEKLEVVLLKELVDYRQTVMRSPYASSW